MIFYRVNNKQNTLAEKRLVDLHVDGKIISVRRDVLVENSAYFEAIFQPQHPGFIEKNSDSLILQVCTHK